MSLKHALLALLAVILWGLNFAISKMGFDYLPPLAFLSLRFVLTALIFLPFIRSVSKEQCYRLIKVALLLNIGHYAFVFLAVDQMNASSTSLLMQMTTPFSLIVGFLAFKEVLFWRHGLGLLVAFIGVYLIVGVPDVTVTGFIFTVISALLWVGATYEMKKLADVPLATFIVYTTGIAAPFLGGVSYFTTDWGNFSLVNIDWMVVGIILIYQCVILSFVMMLWQFLLRHNRFGRLSAISLLQPIFGVLGGILLLSETLTTAILVGGGLTAVGVVLIAYDKMQSHTLKN